VVGIATRYGLDGAGDRIPVAERISATVQTGPRNYPVFCVMDIGSFPEVKRPGNDVEHLPPPSAEKKEGLVLYLYSHNGTS
jgi:hypothetical protein